MNHSRQRFRPPALSQEWKLEKSKKAKRKVKNVRKERIQELKKKEKKISKRRKGKITEHGSAKARWQRAETNDGQRSFKKRIVARHYRRQFCKCSLPQTDRRDRRIRLGHTALLDWSVLSWIGNNQLKHPSVHNIASPNPTPNILGPQD